MSIVLKRDRAVVAALDLCIVLDIDQLLVHIRRGQKVVHPTPPIVLSSYATAVRPVRIHQHSKWVELSE